MTFFGNLPVENRAIEANENARNQIIERAIQHPQREVLEHFDDYFNNGGGIMHPDYGNLLELADVIEARYDAQYGLNLVAAIIRGRLQEERVVPQINL